MGKLRVEVDEEFFRPAEVNHLVDDPTKSREELEWEPEVGLEELVGRMVKVDVGRYGGLTCVRRREIGTCCRSDGRDGGLERL